MNTIMRNIYLVLVAIFFFSLSANGQCYPDRHNTTKATMWKSCVMKMNPNTSRGFSHWIMYTLDEEKHLGAVQIWNLNDPFDLADGMKGFTIDISMDGSNWTQAYKGDMEVSNGEAIYEGSTMAHLGGARAKYILISSMSSHGGNCVGFSEIKIELLDGPCNQETYVLDEIVKSQYWAGHSIEAVGQVEADRTLEFFAAEEISLQPEFEVEKGAEFTADIKPCPDGN